jgi:hypothetical protein
VPVSMRLALNVSLSTMAAHRRGSVKVLVRPENDSWEGMTMFGAAAVRFHVADFLPEEYVGCGACQSRRLEALWMMLSSSRSAWS